MGEWDGFDSLQIDEHDLAKDWSKVPAHLPPMHSGLLVPYRFARAHDPNEPGMLWTDGMVADALKVLREEGAIACRMQLGYEDDFGFLHFYGPSHAEIVHAVVSVVQMLSERLRCRLCLYEGPGEVTAVILDDRDGRGIPEVRFYVAEGERCDRCKEFVCSCPLTEEQQHIFTVARSIRSDRSATAAENGRNAASPGEIR